MPWIIKITGGVPGLEGADFEVPDDATDQDIDDAARRFLMIYVEYGWEEIPYNSE